MRPPGRTCGWLLLATALGAASAPAQFPPPPNRPSQAFASRTTLKEKLLNEEGGSAGSEAAVARGLAWLVKQQKEDGRWSFDGSSKDDIAATAMALLPLLAAGETHKDGKLYQAQVEAGVNFLVGRQTGTGTFTGSSGMYAHALATLALCEAHGMADDVQLGKPAQAAVKYIEKAQAANGSWGYSAGAAGDTSILGFQVEALHVARRMGLSVSGEVLKRAGDFLDSVATDGGARYGYTTRGGRPTLSAVGLLCRQYLGWEAKHPAFGRGTEFLLSLPPSKTNWDIYYYYHATEALRNLGGDAWQKRWNPKMRDLLVECQVKEKGEREGSWDKEDGQIGSSCGRLGTTCFALLTLEVYYRYPPLFRVSELKGGPKGPGSP